MGAGNDTRVLVLSVTSFMLLLSLNTSIVNVNVERQ
jgi:hypothetical protein